MTPLQFHSQLMAYCSKLGASVTSYYRTRKRNDAVGGLANSKHLIWLGADVVYDSRPPLMVRTETALQLGLEFEPEDDHDHLEAP